uniref:Ulp1 protease family, C-terminal catalytic domain-containing protein n=1 Tax=Tanacetum cinerariifolium TaxID=118510 RepID=A0A699GMD0_TANCI|nr:ulp1 protease family, C-terminal catalytic domain-containing protein [Tanacetum cinerariifolium]
MIEDMTKLPLIFGALKEAAHDKINDVPCFVEKGSVNALEAPHQKVINAAKDKTIQVIKKEVPKKINARVAIKRSAKAVEVPPDKVVDAAKKKVAEMTQFKQPRLANKIIKDDYQTPKRRRKIVAQVLEEYLVLSGKRMVFFPCIKLLEEEDRSNHYYLICFNMMIVEIDIIDNIHNDLEDLNLRYGPYAMALINSFIDYLEYIKHPKVDAFFSAIPKILRMTWRTTYNPVDYGLFVMRYMEMYNVSGVWINNMKNEK